MLGKLAMPGALIAISLFLLWQTVGMTSSHAASELFGPAFFPRVVLVGLLLVSALQIIGEVLRHRAVQDRGSRPRLHLGAFMVTIVVTALYIVAMQHAGFIPATLAFQAIILGVVFRLRSLTGLILLPSALTAGYFVIFIRILELPLPQGQGMFREFSRLVYY